MTSQIEVQGYGGLTSSFRGCDAPYEPSLASSASSSQSSISIFSDNESTQSSIASSISDDFRYNFEQARDTALAQAQIRRQLSYDDYKKAAEQSSNACLLKTSTAPSYADVTSVPQEHRQHPRRNSLARNQKPPTLQRQADRKFNFVESLVGKLTISSKYH